MVTESLYPEDPYQGLDWAGRLAALLEAFDVNDEGGYGRYDFWLNISDLQDLGRYLNLCGGLLHLEPNGHLRRDLWLELDMAMDRIRDRVDLFFRTQTIEHRFKGVFGMDKSIARATSASFESMNSAQRAAVFAWIDRVLLCWDENPEFFLSDLDYPLDLVMDCLRTWAFEEVPAAE